MKTVCAWCRCEIAPEVGSGTPVLVTHGICARCADLLERFDQLQMGTLLERLDQPVLCVDDDVRVVFGNRAAAEALGRDPEALRGRLAGEVIECVHAHEPGGCGHTGSCASCVIRGSVGTTWRTGQRVQDADAWQEVFTPDGVSRQHLLVSTERRGGVVLLHIHQGGEKLV